MVVTPLIATAATAPAPQTDPTGLLAGLNAAIAPARQPVAMLEDALRHVVAALDAAGAVAGIRAGPDCYIEAVAGAMPRAQADQALGQLRRLAEGHAGTAWPGLHALPVRCAGEMLGGLAVFAPGGGPGGDHAGGLGSDNVDRDTLQAAASLIGLAAARAGIGRALSDAAAAAREIELAAAIQERLLPRTDPARSPVQGLNRPIRMVSGDFYDYFERPDGRFAFALGDVSGKGVQAALMMSRTASLFRCLAKTIDDPATLLRTLNGEIHEAASRGMFVTMIAGVYDPVSGRARFANAGHEPPLLRHADRSYATFEADVPPLGILGEIAPAVLEAEIGGGELYMFSDGLTEFCDGEDEMLGVEGLIQMVEVSTDTALCDRLHSVLAELEADGWSARDDLTVLTIDGNWIKHDD